MALSGSLPQINLGVQGVTHGGHHKSLLERINQLGIITVEDRHIQSVFFSDSRLNNAFKLCNFISKIMVDFHKRILFSDEAHFWLNGYVNKQNCRIWGEANSQVYVETPLHPEKLTVWCALWAGGILLQKR
ncbi:transposable element Tc3 transposase [Trichonephila clavipes]|nr:transposable element Tc3 transposase [Trichonephila clavipes]